MLQGLQKICFHFPNQTAEYIDFNPDMSDYQSTAVGLFWATWSGVTLNSTFSPLIEFLHTEQCPCWFSGRKNKNRWAQPWKTGFFFFSFPMVLKFSRHQNKNDFLPGVCICVPIYPVKHWLTYNQTGRLTAHTAVEITGAQQMKHFHCSQFDLQNMMRYRPHTKDHVKNIWGQFEIQFRTIS